MAHVNLLAVFVAAIASMAVGSVWYGPIFGKQFMAAMGMNTWTKEQQEAAMKDAWKSYVLQFLASLVMFYVLAGVVVGFGHATATGGMATALIMWAGFVVPIKLSDAVWAGNKTLFWLGIGYYFVNFLLAGLILGAWN